MDSSLFLSSDFTIDLPSSLPSFKKRISDRDALDLLAVIQILGDEQSGVPFILI
jgi:hypothetical protein